MNASGPSKRFNQKSYRIRNVVERCVNRLKGFRRVTIRYE